MSDSARERGRASNTPQTVVFGLFWAKIPPIYPYFGVSTPLNTRNHPSERKYYIPSSRSMYMEEATFQMTVEVDAPADYSEEQIAQFVQDKLDEMDGDVSSARVRGGY